MKKTLLGILVCVCLSALGMEPKQAPGQTLSHEEYLLSKKLPYIFGCISVFYNNIASFDPRDQETIHNLHTWYCQAVTYQAECSQTNCTMPANYYDTLMDQIVYLNSKYNQFPPQNQEINAVQVTQELNEYVGNRLTRLILHKGQLSHPYAQAVEEFDTWHKALTNLKKLKESNGEQIAMSQRVFQEIESGLDLLEEEANLSTPSKPKLGIHRLPYWCVFQSLPNLKAPK